MAGAEEFARLARRLKDAGETGLRRELFQAINDSVKPFISKVEDVEYLKPWMPDRYAEVLASDLKVTALKQAGQNAYGVSLRLKGRTKNRQVQMLERGLLRHPVYPDSDLDRFDWRWSTQTGGMVPGFFSAAARYTMPGIRNDVLSAMHRIAVQITAG